MDLQSAQKQRRTFIQPDHREEGPAFIIRTQRELIESQAAQIVFLKSALRAQGMTPPGMVRGHLPGLTPQLMGLVAHLWREYPRHVDRVTLEANLPTNDHAHDRQLQIVDVAVARIRKLLGNDAIETERGVGWRLGQRLYGLLQAGNL